MKITRNFKTLIVAAIAIFFAPNSNAQETTENKATNYDQGFRLGFGLNGGYVFDDPYDFALGGDVRLQYDLNKRYSITLTTGFTNLFIDGKNNDLGFIPAKAGFKAFFWEDQFYAMGEAGAGFAVTNNYDQTSLILSPSIGYANKNFDISLRYEYYSDFPTVKSSPVFGGSIGEGTGQLGLRIAYGFKL
jgi:hypothetical protein